MAALASLTTPGGAIGDTFGGFVIAQVLDAPGGKYRWQVSEVNERTQRTSLLRGPVTDIPGLTTYLAATYLPLAGGTMAGDLDMDSYRLLNALSINAVVIDAESIDATTSLTIDSLPVATEAYASNASNLASGTVPDARLSANVTLLGNTTTGTGSIARATSPTLTTPVLGAASATTLGVGTTSPTGLPGYSAGIEVRNTATNLPSIRLSNAIRNCGLGVDGTNATFSTNGVQFIIATSAGIGLSSGADRRLWVNNVQNTTKTTSQLEVVSQVTSFVIASFCGAVSQTGDYIRCVDASNNVLFSVGTTGNLTSSGTISAAALTCGATVTGNLTSGGEAFHVNQSSGRSQLYSGGALGWTGGASAATSMDTSVSRVSAGVLQIGTTAANALGSLNLANLTASGDIVLTGPSRTIIVGNSLPFNYIANYNNSGSMDVSGNSLVTVRTGNVERARFDSSGFSVSGSIRPGQFTVATLPSAAANTGRTVQVTDSSVDFPGNIGNTVAGGGANNVDVKSNGTNWRITG